MKIDPRALVPPVIAVVILALVLRKTMTALRSSGSWQTPPHATVRAEDPYARLDQLLTRPLLAGPGRMRDPFAYGAAPPPPATVVRNTTPRPVTPPPEPATPVLTSIIWDADPRATIRYADRDFSVRENSLFADFRVRSISSSQVVLERNGEAVVLTLRPKGE